MSFEVTRPFLHEVVDSDNEKVANELLKTLKGIEQSKNRGEKTNGFPRTYADDFEAVNWLKKANNKTKETYTFNFSLLDATKKNIADKSITFTVEYSQQFSVHFISNDNVSPKKKNEKFTFKFSKVKISDADTDKVYVTVKNSGKAQVSILPYSFFEPIKKRIIN